MTTERQIQHDILAAIGSRPDLRCWRANTGAAVPLATVRVIENMLASGNVRGALLECRRARPVTFGVAGQADISGVVLGGRRLEIEVKSDTGRQSEQQRAFEAMMRAHGGIYILARSVEDAVRGIAEA